MAHTQKKVATLVGCNYFNTRNELRGCINDVKSMQSLLLERFGFKEENIVVLTDAPDSSTTPTGANIRSALKQMIEGAEPGDVLLFHYSGHGTLIPHRSRRHNAKKDDEAIVPCDFNLITDVDFRQLVDGLPEGASFTIVSDSCHSGGLIDKEKEQIGPESSSMDTKKRKNSSKQREKRIPYHELLQHVSSMSTVESEHVGDHLMNIFGDEASPKFSSKDEDSTTISEDDGILLSGCQKNETSADMSPEDDEDGGKAYGAFSHAIQNVVKGINGGPVISNRELVLRARELLKEQGFSQHPCLYCSDANADAPFLSKLD